MAPRPARVFEASRLVVALVTHIGAMDPDGPENDPVLDRLLTDVTQDRQLAIWVIGFMAGSLYDAWEEMTRSSGDTVTQFLQRVGLRIQAEEIR